MKLRFNNIRKFQSSGKIEKKSIWDKLDDYAAKAEIPLAIGAAGATMATAATGGLAVPAMILNIGSAGIDAYQAARNLYKGNYAQAGLDGIELLAGLIGAKYAAKATAVPAKAVRIEQAARKGATPLEREYLRLKATVRMRRLPSKGMTAKEAEALRGAAFSMYGLSSASLRNLIQSAPVDNTRVAQRRVYKRGGTAPDPTKGRFTFKKSLMIKNAEKLNGKRDMRKKLVKSDVVTNKKRILKGLKGLKFATYVPVETSAYEPIDPFSDYNFPSTYKEYITAEPVLLTVEQPKELTDTLEEAPKLQPLRATRIVNHIYKDRDKWVKDLREAYIKAGITNENALKMLIAQDALESGWGKSAQGKFNYGNLTPGSSWKGEVVVGRDKNGKGQAIQLKFRSYNSIDEYAADKVQFLKNLYDFDENDDIATFTRKLQGGNRGKRRYAEGNNYVLLVTKIYNTSKL